jgi:hypothetical protein
VRRLTLRFAGFPYCSRRKNKPHNHARQDGVNRGVFTRYEVFARLGRPVS